MAQEYVRIPCERYARMIALIEAAEERMKEAIRYGIDPGIAEDVEFHKRLAAELGINPSR